MSSLTELFAHELLRNAVWAGLLASVLCGILGTFVVVKRLVFLGGGISHAAFGGLGLCHFLGFPPLWGAGAVAVISAVVLGLTGRATGRRGKSADAVIGILWAVGMAVGVVFLYKTPGYAPDLMSFLFGNLLAVSRTEVLVTLGFVAGLLAILGLFYDELVAVTFDQEFAAVQGVAVTPFLTLLLVLIAVGLVLLIQLVGILLVLALLTIPPVISLRFARRLPTVMVLSTAVGIVMTLGGLTVSYAWDLPSGPAIVLLGAAALGAVETGDRLWPRGTPLFG
jgi:zinc transport system permease protein